MQWPTRHEPHQASQIRPHARLTHSFVRDLHADLDGLQPTRTGGITRALTSYCAPPDGACSGDKRSQTSLEAPADSKSLSCWGRAISRIEGFKHLVTMVEAPHEQRSAVLVSVCLPMKQIVAQTL